MRHLKRALCLIAALLLLLPAGLGASSEDGLVRIYSSPDGLEAGQCFFDFNDEDYDRMIWTRRYNSWMVLGHSESECLAYANERHPADMAALENAEWYLDADTGDIYVKLPPDANIGMVFEIKDRTTGLIGSDEAMSLLNILYGVDLNSLTWQSVGIPDRPETVIEPHGSLYINLNLLYNDRFEEFLVYAETLPGYDDLSDEELLRAADQYAMLAIDIFSDAELYYTEGSEVFALELITHEEDGRSLVYYFPYESLRPLGSDFDPLDYVMPSHDYYWCNWNWKGPDEVEAEIVCYLGELDGTNDTVKITLTGDDIQKTVLREPTETTDGIVECVATVTYLDDTYTSRVMTFDIPATGDPERLTVTKQPEEAYLRYPEGATFSVEVDKPENVVSYQWMMADSVRDYTLEGFTAFTDTLVIPSTSMDLADCKVWCVITDTNGNRVCSDKVDLVITNRDEYLRPLYVGDYALLPGESLDLSKTPLGTGYVSYDDAHNVTFKDVNISTDGISCDYVITPSFGVFWDGREGDHDPYFMHFEGDCVFEDNCFDPSMNSGGVVINSHFRTENDDTVRSLTVEVLGSLTVKGGSDAIYTDADITVSTGSITTVPLETNYNTGISGWNVTIGEGVCLDITCVGTAITARDSLTVKDNAEINIDYTLQHVTNAYTEGKAILAHGDMFIHAADITIDVHAHPEQFDPWGLGIAYAQAVRCDKDVSFYGTNLSITMEADEGTGPYAQNFCGIGGDLDAVLLEDGAKVTIDIDSDNIFFANGISPDDSFAGMFCELYVGEDCVLDVTVHASGGVTGIYIPYRITVEDGTLDIDASTDVGYAIGIDGTVMRVILTDCNYGVNVTTDAPNDACLAVIMEFDMADGEYTEGYSPSYLILEQKAEILEPLGGSVNLFSLDVGADEPLMILCETVYGPDDREEPVGSVSIGVSGHTVTFVENGEEVSVRVTEGESVPRPDDPDIYGYDFEGWFADEELTVPFDFSAPIEKDTKVYADLRKVEYTCVSGTDLNWVSGSGKAPEIIIKRSRRDDECFDHFAKLVCDGRELVWGEDYTAEAGSTVIKLSETFLKGLKAGKHDLTAVFDDGEVPLKLAVSIPSGQDTPFTGVDTKMDLWMILIGISAAALVMIRATRGRRERKRV